MINERLLDVDGNSPEGPCRWSCIVARTQVDQQVKRLNHYQDGFGYLATGEHRRTSTRVRVCHTLARGDCGFQWKLKQTKHTGGPIRSPLLSA